MKRLAEIRGIGESDKQLMLEVKEAVTRLVPDAEVVLYGSTARGTRRSGSDYDVMAITGRNLSDSEKRAIQGTVYQNLELVHGFVISVSVCSREEWNSFLREDPLRENVVKEGIVL